MTETIFFRMEDLMADFTTEQETEMTVATVSIRAAHGSTFEAKIEMGRNLRVIHSLHATNGRNGEFKPYVEKNTPIDYNAAIQYMRVYDAFGDMSAEQIVYHGTQFRFGALRTLSLRIKAAAKTTGKTVPQAREELHTYQEAIRRAEQGEIITKEIIDELWKADPLFNPPKKRVPKNKPKEEAPPKKNRLDPTMDEVPLKKNSQQSATQRKTAKKKAAPKKKRKIPGVKSTPTNRVEGDLSKEPKLQAILAADTLRDLQTDITGAFGDLLQTNNDTAIDHTFLALVDMRIAICKKNTKLYFALWKVREMIRRRYLEGASDGTTNPEHIGKAV